MSENKGAVGKRKDITPHYPLPGKIAAIFREIFKIF
jgi:hypothetical protein